jgi:hypothetical protein
VQGGNAFGATAVLGTTDNNALDLRVNNARVMRYEPNAISPNVIGGSQVNSAAAGVRGATVAGGGVAANAEPDFAFDAPNVVTDAYGTVGGGFANRAGDNAGTAIDAPFATVAGGWANRASSNSSTVSGGAVNTASGFRSNVAGGEANTASGPYGSVAGGIGNVAAGVASFAGGAYAQATHDGSFAWSDASNPVLFPTTADHEFAVRSTGGARFVTGTDVDGNTTRSVRINPNGELEFGAVTRQHLNLFGATYAMGVQPLTVYFRTGPSVSVNYGGFSWFRDGAHIDDVNNPGAGGVEMMRLALNGTLYVTGGTVGTLSDRGSKQDFAAVDPASVLARVVQLPLAEWSYRNNPSVRHVGPTAQDFRAAFGLGDDDARSIATVDADGIALAAIQGLHLELKKRDAEIAELRRAVEALLARPAP